MKTKIKQEFITNIKYIYVSFLIVFLTILPQLLMSHTIKHVIGILLLAILLIFTAKFSKILFSVFTIYINIVNIIHANVYLHWGGESSLNSRFEIMVRSPLSESIEYLHSFVDYRDYLIMGYTILIFILLYNFILKHQHNFNFLKKISIISSLILLSILITREPLSTIKNYIKIRNGFLNNNIIIKQRNQYLKNISLKKDHNITVKYNKIIVIQGESVNKNYMNNITSPFLFSLINNKKAYQFNVIAPANQTRYAVPMIFTKANVNNWKYNFIHSESIVTDFKNINYKTYWISNQGHIGKHDDWITNIANEANVKIFFNSGDYSEAKSDDVINHYLDKLKTDNDNEMYVFHLIGSHFQYTSRYTNQHLLYKNPKKIIQEYKNTIYFTDYVIKNIFKHFKNNGNILIVYLSDHGEVVNNSKHGHGFLPTYKDEYEIPLVIYSNIKNDRIKKLYIQNKKHYFNTENMNSIIKYISFLSDDVNISTSSQIFSLNPKNKFNFDKLESYK
jgi:glucan phosphoethanolaminetransferase (alkaline phosphatase superfamily)